jgi:hypothetical protein
MGKRELLLLVVFVVLGIGVYQVSAPAAPAEGPGFSLSRLVQMAKAHIHGPSVRRAVSKTASMTPGEGVTVIDLGEIRGAVLIEGGDREDIEVRLEAMVGGMDEADVNRQERELSVALASDDEAATVKIGFDHAGRPPRFELHVKVPARMTARIGGRGSAEVRGVAGLDLAEFRGELTTEDLHGPVTGEMRDSRAEFGPGATLAFTADRGRLRADAPASVTLESSHASIDIVDPAGPVTLKQEQCRIDVRGTGGPVKVTGEGGTIELRQVTHPITIEADRLTVTAELDAPVATVIAIENDDVEVTLPRGGGVQLEVSVRDGQLRLPEDWTATESEGQQSYSGKVGSGGPLVKATLERGTMRIRSRGAQSGT